MLEKDFKNFETRYDKDQESSEAHWRNFYAFKEELLANTKKPSSFKDIIIAIGATLSIVTVLIGAMISLVDSRIAVPIEQGKITNAKVEYLIKKQNELINLTALQSAKFGTMVEKVNGNTEFVNEYMYKEKIPSVLTSIEKDIEFLKIKERSNNGKR